MKKGIEQIPSVPTLSVFFGRGIGSLKTVIVVQEDRTARPNGNIGSTMGTSVVAKLGPTPCCSCSVLCVCSAQLPTFVPRRRRGQQTLTLELAHVLEGTRIHSLGRAIVMSREWEKQWCLRVLEAWARRTSQLYRVFYIDSPKCYRSH